MQEEQITKESIQGKENHIWLCEGQPHVNDHSIEDSKGVFWHTHKSLWEEGSYSKEGFEEQVVQHEYGEGWDHGIFMHKYFMKDQIESINVETDEDDLLQTTIDGLPASWETFLVVVNGREEHPNFEILWHDCIQE